MDKKVTRGMAGIFLEESKILRAAAKVRESGFTKYDAISPYPIHGMEEACGIQRSTIPYVSFGAACLGLLAALSLVYYTAVVNWPINVGGKPMFSLPAFVPIMFELTVLFSALCSVGALFYHCNMPKIDPPVIDKDLTCHKFAIFIPENDTGYSEDRIEKMLKDLGAVEVKKVAEY